MDKSKRVAMLIFVGIAMMTVGKNIMNLGWYELAFWLMAVLLTFLCHQYIASPNIRIRNGILLWSLLFTGVFLVLWWGSGYIDGFGHSPNSRSPIGMLRNAGLYGGIIAAQEWTRAYLAKVDNRENHWAYIAAACAFFIYTISFDKVQIALKSWGSFFPYVGGTVLPGICGTIFLTWMAKKSNWLPSLAYRLAPEAVQWLLPVLPNSSWQTKMLLGAAFPIFSMMIMQQLILPGKRDRRKKWPGLRKHRAKPASLAGMIVSIALLFSFSLGLLPYKPMVIATGSMLPVIRPGDLVIIQETDTRSLQKGDIIAYKTQGYQIVHRVMTVLPSRGGNSYILKGDNNDAPDMNAISESQIVGKIVQVIPYVGLLSLTVRKTASPQSIPVQTGR